MSVLCQLCGLPRFEGAAGYVGPQCRCLWVRLPKKQDAIEADDGARALPPKAHHAAPFLEMRIAELERENAVLRAQVETLLTWQEQAFVAHPNIDMDMSALAKIKEES